MKYHSFQLKLFEKYGIEKDENYIYLYYFDVPIADAVVNRN